MFASRCFLRLKQAALAWNEDNIPTYGAALAYYSAFSLAPLLLLAIGIASLILGDQAAHSGLREEMRHSLGPPTAEALVAILDNANKTGADTHLTILGLVTLLLGASGVFVQLQTALNVIWKTSAPVRTGNVVLHFIRNRLLSFTAVLCTGLLLLAMLISSSILAAVQQRVVAPVVLGGPLVWQALSIFTSLAFTAILFALVFKLLPDTEVHWPDAWRGALLTSVLFTLGQHLISFYLGYSGSASAFGAVGSFVVWLVWVYYSAQIVLFGAEFAHSCAGLDGASAVTPPAESGG